MRIYAALCLTCLIVILADGQTYRPKEGYVPDSATALKIAEAVLISVYGAKQIKSEQPFTARLKDGVWIVSGMLRCSGGTSGTTASCEGGVAVVKISKGDAPIVSMIHGQ